MTEPRVANVQRVKHQPLHGLAIRLAGDALDNGSKNREAQVRVVLLRPRIEVQRARQRELNHVPIAQLRGRLSHGARDLLLRRIVLIAGGMIEQLPNGDPPDAPIDRLARPTLQPAQKRESRIVKSEPPVVDHLQDGDGRDRLRHAGEAKDRRGPGRYLALDPSPAKPTGVHEPLVLGDRKRRPGCVMPAHQLAHLLAKALQPRQSMSGGRNLAVSNRLQCGIQRDRQRLEKLSTQHGKQTPSIPVGSSPLAASGLPGWKSTTPNHFV